MTIARVTAWPAPTLNWQAQLGTLVFGGNTQYRFREIEGLGTPAMRVSDTPKARAHGGMSGIDKLDIRQMIFHIMTRPTTSLMPALNSALRGAFAPTDGSDVGLTLVFPGWDTLLFIGRPRGAEYGIDLKSAWRQQSDVMARFFAMDPHIYSNTLQSATLNAPTAGPLAGLAFETVAYIGAVFETGSLHGATFGSGATPGGGSAGVVSAVNNGNASMAPVTTIYGPTNGASIVHGPTGAIISTTYNLLAGQWMEIDHELHSALLNSVSNQQATLTAPAEGWLLPPGTSDIHYLGDAGSFCTFQWRDAWF